MFNRASIKQKRRIKMKALDKQLIFYIANDKTLSEIAIIQGVSVSSVKY